MNNLMVKVAALPGGKSVSGTVTILAISTPKGVYVGDGFIIWDWITDMQSYPILIGFNNQMLPTGPYDIQVVEEKLAVISFNIH